MSNPTNVVNAPATTEAPVQQPQQQTEQPAAALATTPAAAAAAAAQVPTLYDDPNDPNCKSIVVSPNTQAQVVIQLDMFGDRHGGFAVKPLTRTNKQTKELELAGARFALPARAKIAQATGLVGAANKERLDNHINNVRREAARAAKADSAALDDNWGLMAYEDKTTAGGVRTKMYKYVCLPIRQITPEDIVRQSNGAVSLAEAKAYLDDIAAKRKAAEAKPVIDVESTRVNPNQITAGTTGATEAPPVITEAKEGAVPTDKVANAIPEEQGMSEADKKAAAALNAEAKQQNKPGRRN